MPNIQRTPQKPQAKPDEVPRMADKSPEELEAERLEEEAKIRAETERLPRWCLDWTTEQLDFIVTWFSLYILDFAPNIEHFSLSLMFFLSFQHKL